MFANILKRLVLIIQLASFVLAQPKEERWVTAWATANVDVGNSIGAPLFASSGTPAQLENRTIRNIVHLALGGDSIRVRLANTFGDQAVTFNSVYVGLQSDGVEIVKGSNRDVTFAGRRSITLPEASEAMSDPIAIRVTPGQNISISIFVAGGDGAPTVHPNALQTNYISDAGDFASQEKASAFRKTAHSWYFLQAVDIRGNETLRGAVIALGDSITDGASARPNKNERWTDILAQRLASGPIQYSVLNAGIGGNRILTSSPCFGVNALARLQRDVFSHFGGTAVMVFEGTNDIGQPDTPAPAESLPCLAHKHVAAQELIGGYQQIITQSHAHGMKVFGATILPFQGYAGWTEKGETTRLAVNEWIRGGNAFDGVIDFDGALRDSDHPARLRREYDSGDHLHPSPAGHSAMAAAVKVDFR